jgi:hypothetical protein
MRSPNRDAFQQTMLTSWEVAEVTDKDKENLSPPPSQMTLRASEASESRRRELALEAGMVRVTG